MNVTKVSNGTLEETNKMVSELEGIFADPIFALFQWDTEEDDEDENISSSNFFVISKDKKLMGKDTNGKDMYADFFFVIDIWEEFFDINVEFKDEYDTGGFLYEFLLTESLKSYCFRLSEEGTSSSGIDKIYQIDFKYKHLVSKTEKMMGLISEITANITTDNSKEYYEFMSWVADTMEKYFRVEFDDEVRESIAENSDYDPE